MIHPGMVVLALVCMESAEQMKLLQGTWGIVAMEVEGNRIEFRGKRRGHQRVTIADGTISWSYIDPELGEMARFCGTYRWLERGVLELTMGHFNDVPEDRKSAKGLYRLDGNTLTICHSKTGELPKEFKTKSGDGCTIDVFQRVQRRDK